MHYLVSGFIIFWLSTCVLAITDKRPVYLSGIPVPGIKVPVLRLFEHYAASCNKRNPRDFGFDQIAQIMQLLHGEQVAQKIYNGLFHQIADIQPEQLIGKWYTVVDTAKFHPESCPIFYFSLISRTDFTATYTSTMHANKDDNVVTYEGLITATGKEASGVLISTGHPNDQCPYFPVKFGGLNLQKQYNYMILSTPIKYPTMVLARDLFEFESKYQKEVYTFLENSGFLSPIAALNSRLNFLNTTLCSQTNMLYDQPSSDLL